MTPKRSKRCVLDKAFVEDLLWWTEHNPRIAVRVLRLIGDVLRDPTTGIGKPELLKSLGPGMWSRRITQEHRLTYCVTADTIDFLQARHHY